MHVPKTAGNAVAVGLRHALLPKSELFGWDMSNFGTFRDIDSFVPVLRKLVHETSASMRPDVDFVTGHLAHSTLVGRYPGIQCITFLREPVSRLLSHWMFMRSHNDANLASWGSYAERQKLARRRLAEFLSAEQIASQTDNIVCRKLLWPSPLVPDDGFIDPADDAAILDQARAKLDGFAFVDAVENAGLADNLTAWLGRKFTLAVFNETLTIPPVFRSRLDREMSPDACALLQSRCRLDRVLWEEIVRRRMPNEAPDAVRTSAILRNTARFAALMAA